MKPILLLLCNFALLGSLYAQTQVTHVSLPGRAYHPDPPTWLNQAELESWGNLKGIRISGQLVPFETSIRLAYPGGPYFNHTEKEWQRPHFERSGLARTVTTRLDSVYIKETVEDLSPGNVRITISYRAAADVHLKDIEFSIKTAGGAGLEGGSGHAEGGGPYDELTLIDSTGTHLINLHDSTGYNQILHLGNMARGDSSSSTFELKAKTRIDRTPAEIQVGSVLGTRAFEGMGGNFRIQNLRLDPSIIDYNLARLRVAMGRVEMPWRSWQPALTDKPLDSAHAGKLSPDVKRAMDMAARLGSMQIPLILTAWFPPDWAIIGPVKFQPGPDHVWGNELDSSRMQEVYASLADYIQCLKDLYKTDIRYFSFNESDLGINVRMTGAQHLAFIKGFGKYLQARGLNTRVLLGDNSDATTWSFILPALADPETRPYIGAVSFHSWRGWGTETLEHWAKAADQLGVPLYVGEGSIDAAAHSYPKIFLEPSYALEEVGLYVKLINVCQPNSILQWQLTSDYSLLTGLAPGDSLQPTQRFWNFKQLASTPAHVFHLPVTSSRKEIGAAALGNNNGAFALHLVNLGPDRLVHISGVPRGLQKLTVWITSQDQSMKQEKLLQVSAKGSAELTLPAGSFVSLMGE